MLIGFTLPIRSYENDHVIETTIYYECNKCPTKDEIIEDQKRLHEERLSKYSDYLPEEGLDIIHALETMDEYKYLYNDGLCYYSFNCDVIGFGVHKGNARTIHPYKIAGR